MKHILVIADHAGSEQHAFEKALELARLTIADIHVVSFCYEPLSDVQYQYHTNNSHTSRQASTVRFCMELSSAPPTKPRLLQAGMGTLAAMRQRSLAKT